jgi:hypothetical protein
MRDPSEKSLESISGWLLLPLLGLIYTPLRLSNYLYHELLPVFNEGYWELLTTPGNEAYHPYWGPLLVGEVVGNTILIILSVVTLGFFLQRSHFAPRLVIALLTFSFVVVIADFFLADLIPAVAEQSDSESIREVARSLFGVAIWIPYFLVSKRVKATFTR